MANSSSQIVPPQKTGASKKYEHVITLPSLEEAKKQFQSAKARLLDISHWEQVAGKGSAQFVLTDKEGQPVQRKPNVGDHIKIDIPSPTHQHDWVRIESMVEPSGTEETESIGIKVRPTSNPITKENHVSHFFSPESTSSFLLRREKTKLIAQVHGRNEVPNSETKSLWQKIKNWAVALGAMAGVADIQWEGLVKGLLQPEKTK